MEFIIAKSGGFCRGVKLAVDTALSIDPQNTYIYGEIIHNPDVVAQITARGIKTVNSLGEVPNGATLIIRSHGVSKEIYDILAVRIIFTPFLNKRIRCLRTATRSRTSIRQIISTEPIPVFSWSI